MSKAKDFYSKSVPEAIRQACDDFATSQEKLDIEVLETGSKGIFGLCKKRAHIRVNLKKNIPPEEVDVQKDTRPDKKKKRKPVPKKEKDVTPQKVKAPADDKQPKTGSQEPVSKESKGSDQNSEKEQLAPPAEENLASVKKDLEQILALMGFPSEIVLDFDGQSIQCNIKSDDDETLVGDEGRILDSLQYLIRKMASTHLPDRMTVDLDVGNFREQRMEELQKRAAEMAEKVKETGKTMAIPALNPAERRVVHVALQDDKKVRSRSVGDGIFKKVLIFKPGSKGRKSGPKRRGRQGGGSAKQ